MCGARASLFAFLIQTGHRPCHRVLGGRAARSNATGDANAITRLRRVVVGIDVAVLPLTDPRATRGLLGVDHGVEDVAIETTGGGAAVDARKAGAKEVEGDGFSGASVGVGE